MNGEDSVTQPYSDIRRLLIPAASDTVEISVPTGCSFSLQNTGSQDVYLGTDAGSLLADDAWILQGYVAGANTSNEIHFPQGWGTTLVATGAGGVSALIIITKGPVLN